MDVKISTCSIASMSRSEASTEIVQVFAANLRARRIALGLSQEALADRARLDRTYVSSCERGLRNVTLTSLAQLSAALGVQPWELLGTCDNGQ